MQLADVIHHSQLTEKAVRLYEAEGLIAPVNGSNGRRVYSGEDLARLKSLDRGWRVGFARAARSRQSGLLWDTRASASGGLKMPRGFK